VSYISFLQSTISVPFLYTDKGYSISGTSMQRVLDRLCRFVCGRMRLLDIGV
jgi:hypothetical protein